MGVGALSLLIRKESASLQSPERDKTEEHLPSHRRDAVDTNFHYRVKQAQKLRSRRTSARIFPQMADKISFVPSLVVFKRKFEYVISFPASRSPPPVLAYVWDAHMCPHRNFAALNEIFLILYVFNVHIFSLLKRVYMLSRDYL